MLVNRLNIYLIREGKELKAPRYANTAAIYNDYLSYSQYKLKVEKRKNSN